MLLNLLLAIVLIVCAYSGNFSPIRYGGWVGVLSLFFGYVLIVTVALFVAQIFFFRRGAWVLFFGMLVCAGPILTYCPVNVTRPTAPADSETFTLMSFNAHQFVKAQTHFNTDTVNNPQLEYILKTDADIVCLQEGTFVNNIRPGYLTASQVLKLSNKYPHMLFNCDDLVLMSKFPVESIHLDNTQGLMGCYRITFGSGRKITLFNVHLHSMHLGEDDRELYVQLTELKRENFGAVKQQLLKKISAAAVGRAKEVTQLLRYIRLYGGPDVIVTGDFNDVPGCYGLRELADVGFKSVYPQIGLGPIITFADRRMFFCIDHTLYRGDIIPLKIAKGPQSGSDHYPIVTTFCLPPKKY